MKKLPGDDNFTIDNNIISLIAKGIRREGGHRKLAKIIGCNPSCIGMWTGTAKTRSAAITWELWRNLRNYLASHGDIELRDPRYMLPTELRAALMSQSSQALTQDESELIALYRSMNALGQELTLDTARANADKAALVKGASTSGAAGDADVL